MIVSGYQEMKSRHREEVNAFEGIFFAFNNEQFAEGVRKVGASAENKVTKIGGGGYILVNRVDALTEMLVRHDAELKALRAQRKELVQALAYELDNHEYCITRDPREAVEALGMQMSDVPADVLREAKKKARQS